MMVKLTILIFFTTHFYRAKAFEQQCNYISTIDYEFCSWDAFVKMEGQVVNNTEQCVVESVCNHEFRLTLQELNPYTLWFQDITKMLNICCGKCARLKIIRQIIDPTELTSEILNETDIMFPYLERSDATAVHGMSFIPMFDAPSAFYITVKDDIRKTTLMNILNASLEIWPLLVMCILLAFISGFIAWLLDTWKNADEFPRPFLPGVFNGFWWAFVSMTTVGYGDKTPQSKPARLYSICWILIGISICSMFTAEMTNQITKSTLPVIPEIKGKEIGWIYGRLYDAILIAQNGGRVYKVNHKDTFTAIKEMFKSLSMEEGIFLNKFKGIILDSYTLSYYKISMANRTEPDDLQIKEMLSNKTIHTEIKNNGKKLSYGMLVRNLTHAHYFRKYFTDNKHNLQTCMALVMNGRDKKEEEDFSPFDPKGGLFWPSFAASMGCLVLICVFGLFFELKRRNMICKSMKIDISGEEQEGKQNTSSSNER